MSLKDQLLKSGAVNKKRAKQVDHEGRNKKNKQAQQQETEQKRKDIERKAAEQREKDIELNRIKNEEAEQKAIQAQIRQLIEVNRQRKSEKDAEEVSFSFVDADKVKNIYVSEKIQRHLSQGLLVIARFDQGYELVPAKIAEKIAMRDDSSLIKIADAELVQSDEDDPYADYQIPDDLMW